MKDELTVLLIQAQILELMIIAYAKRVLSEEDFEVFVKKQGLQTERVETLTNQL